MDENHDVTEMPSHISLKKPNNFHSRNKSMPVNTIDYHNYQKMQKLKPLNMQHSFANNVVNNRSFVVDRSGHMPDGSAGYYHQNLSGNKQGPYSF